MSTPSAHCDRISVASSCSSRQPPRQAATGIQAAQHAAVSHIPRVTVQTSGSLGSAAMHTSGSEVWGVVRCAAPELQSSTAFDGCDGGLHGVGAALPDHARAHGAQGITVRRIHRHPCDAAFLCQVSSPAPGSLRRGTCAGFYHAWRRQRRCVLASSPSSRVRHHHPSCLRLRRCHCGHRRPRRPRPACGILGCAQQQRNTSHAVGTIRKGERDRSVPHRVIRSVRDDD